MPVVFTLPPPKTDTWYLAYGSNLSSAKFIHDRGIVPIATAVVTVPGWTLVMHSAGVPYSEPSFASILPVGGTTNVKSVELIGTAYKLTPMMYQKVLASEGGGIAYAEVEIRAELLVEYNDVFPVPRGRTFATRSLVTVLRRAANPSARYMNLLCTGAAETDMPCSYQEFLANIPVYHPPVTKPRRIGAALFLAFWIPVMSVMEKITKADLRKSKTGSASNLVVIMVRAVVLTMWFYHDHIHAPIWGRGDGFDLTCS